MRIDPRHDYGPVKESFQEKYERITEDLRAVRSAWTGNERGHPAQIVRRNARMKEQWSIKRPVL
jgi:hypothetical protein